MVVALVVVSVAASVGVEGMPSFNWWGTSGETYDDVLDPVASGSGKTLAALDEAVSIQTIPLLLKLTSVLATPCLLLQEKCFSELLGQSDLSSGQYLSCFFRSD